MNCLRILILLGGLSVIGYTAQAQDVYVDEDDIWVDSPDNDNPGTRTTYYVRKSGSDSNTGLNRNQAFLTINKAMSLADAGDIVHIGAGDYDENLSATFSGNASKKIYFYGDTTGRYTGDAGAVRVRGTSRGVPLTIRAHYLVFRGINFVPNDPIWAKDNLYQVITSTGNSQFIDCTIEGGIYGWIAVGGNVNFTRCTIRNNKIWGVVHYNGALTMVDSFVVDNGLGVYSYAAYGLTYATAPKFTTNLLRTQVLRNAGCGVSTHGNRLLLNNSKVEENGRVNKDWGVVVRDAVFTPSNGATIQNNWNGLLICEDSYNKGALKSRSISNFTFGPNDYHGLQVYLTNLTLTNVNVTAGVHPFYSHGFRYWSYGDGSAMNPSSPVATVTMNNCSFHALANYQWESNDADGNLAYRYTHAYSVAYHTKLNVNNSRFTIVPQQPTETIGGIKHYHYGHGLLTYGHKWWNDDGSSNNDWPSAAVDRVACSTNVTNSTFKDFPDHGIYAYYTSLNLNGGEFSGNGITNRGGWGVHLTRAPLTTTNNPLIKNNWCGLHSSGREYAPQTQFDDLNLSNLTLTDNYYHGVLTYFHDVAMNNVTITGSAYPFYAHGFRYWGYPSGETAPVGPPSQTTLTNCVLKVNELRFPSGTNTWDDVMPGKTPTGEYYRHGRAIHAYHTNLTLTNTEITRDPTSHSFPDTNSLCTSHWSAGVYFHCGAWWTTPVNDRVAGTLTLNNVNIHDMLCHGVESYESEGTVMNGGRIERNGTVGMGGWGVYTHTKFTPSNNPVISDNHNGLYIFGGYSQPQVVNNHPDLDGLVLTNNKYHGLLIYLLNVEVINAQITGSMLPFYNHGYRYWAINGETAEDQGGQVLASTVKLTNSTLTGKRWEGNYWRRNNGVWEEAPYEWIGYSINYHSNMVVTNCEFSSGNDKEGSHGLVNYGHRWWNHTADPYDPGIGNTIEVKNSQFHHLRHHGLYAYRTGKVTIDGGSFTDNGTDQWSSWVIYMNEVDNVEVKNNPAVTGNYYGAAFVGRHLANQERYSTLSLKDWTISNNERNALTVQLYNATLENLTLTNNHYGCNIHGFRYWSYPSGQTPAEVDPAIVTIKNCTINDNKRTYTNTDGSTYDYGWGLNIYHTQLTVENSQINNNAYYGMLSYGHNWWTPATPRVPKSGTVVTNCQLTGNRHHGLHGHMADISVTGSTITGDGSNNGHGVYVYDSDVTFGAGNSIENWSVGASLYASNEWHQRPWGHAHAAIENLTIQNNYSYGMIVQGRSLSINNCTFTNNGSYGIYIHGHPYWTRDVDGDGDQDMPPLMTNATVNVNNTSITGNTNWGVVNYHSNLTLNNLTIDSATSGYGVYSAGHNWWETSPDGKPWNEFAHSYDFIGSTTLNNCDITARNSWGVHSTWQRTLTLNNSKVSGTNYIGVYLHKPLMFDTVPGVLTLNNTEVTGHASYGIYCEQTKIQIDAASAAKLKSNYHGLCIYGHQDHLEALKVQLADLTISQNTGIGLLIYRASADLQRLTLENNTGRGLYIDGNVATGQPYVGSLDMTDCVLRNNGSYGLQANLGGPANISTCRFEGNDHGAIFYAPGINIDRCDVRNNWRWGIQLQPKTGTVATMKNTVIADNANGIWYGPYENAAGDLQLWNCTIASNNDTYGRGYYTSYGLYQNAGTATVRNCIFKDSPSYGVYRAAGTTSVAYSMFHGNGNNLGNVTAGDKVITTSDPKFENLVAGDYHLKASSRAINVGLTATGVVDIDREGRPRPLYNKWELGAYEFPDESGIRFIESWTETGN